MQDILIPTNFNFFTDIFSAFDVSLLCSLMIGLGLLLVMYGLLSLLVKLVFLRLKIRQAHTLFEIKPPRSAEQSAYTTQQLFNLIHSLANQRPWQQRLFRVSKNYSFEIVSTKEDGIRYLIRVGTDDADLIKKSLISFLPGVRISESKDYLQDSLDKPTIAEFKLANHFAFPLKDQEVLNQHDPIAFITGSMTKLTPSELVAFQLVVSPITKTAVTDIKRISKLIYNNKDLSKNISQNGIGNQFIPLIRLGLHVGAQILLLPIGMLVFALSDGKEGPFLSLPIFDASKKTNNPYQAELEILVKAKLDQPLFFTSIRLLTAGTDKVSSSKRVKGLSSALSSFDSSYQALVKIRRLKLNLFDKLTAFAFKHRLHLSLSKSVLSINEVGDIYHFPFMSTTKTEDLVKSHSKELPAPLGLKRAKELDVVFAQNTYGNTITPVGLSVEERRRHMYILGATGTGKSTMLLSMIESDVRNGKGLAVIDPHGDLIEQILQCIPEERIKDVVYFNPDDIGYPMGINLLELTPGLSEDDSLREKEFITESIISLFHKIYTEKNSGPRMEYILRNTIHTSFTVPGATLFTINKLLINTPFRKSVVRKLKDENLRDFWKYEFAKAGDYQKVNMILPITNKIGRFLFSPTAKRILEQEKSTINFDQIMNECKIFLCNLSKGKIGEDNSEVFGVLVMAKIQLAALKRSRMKPEDRKDFYLYVDEFQNFATPSFAQILSEARKYRLSAVLAHQTTSQLEDSSLVNVTLANTGTVICFRTANPEDEKMILPQFRPYVEQGEIANLPSFHFYMKLGALNPEEPFSGKTIPVIIEYNQSRINSVIESSRQLFAKEWNENPVKQVPAKKILKDAKPLSSVGLLP